MGLQFTQRDPLTRTFSFTQNRATSAVGVKFTQKDASIPVTVQVRGVTTGLPNEVVLAEKVISPYCGLKNHKWGLNVRLEQERINWG